MKEIKDYLTELEKINIDIINLEYIQNKTYRALIDRIMIDCSADIHPDVIAQLNKVKKIHKIGYWVHDVRKKLFMGTRELLLFLEKEPKQESFPEEEFFNLIHKDDLMAIQTNYAQTMLTHEDSSSAYRFVVSNNQVKYVISHFSTKFDDQHKPIQVNGIIFEIPQTED